MAAGNTQIWFEVFVAPKYGPSCSKDQLENNADRSLDIGLERRPYKESLQTCARGDMRVFGGVVALNGDGRR